MEQKLTGPITKEIAKTLRAGDEILYTGSMYTARDAAHKRLVDLLERGEELPIDLTNAMMYYVGPTPTKPNEIIGSAGPTTSYRMDAYTPQLLAKGMTAMVGKGLRSDKVVESMIEHGAVYFATIGGAAALVARAVVKCEEVCYPDLGSESIKRLEVVDFPMTVVIDTKGDNLYKISRER